MTSRIAELNNYVSRYRQRAQAAQGQRYGRGQRLAESNASKRDSQACFTLSSSRMLRLSAAYDKLAAAYWQVVAGSTGTAGHGQGQEGKP
jgi:predicted secreted protein